MQIVIDIPEVFYESLKDTDVIVSGQRSGKTLMSVIYTAVANGTPLQKGHGRLIDADKLLESDEIIADSRKCHYIPMIDVYEAPTIIESE